MLLKRLIGKKIKTMDLNRLTEKIQKVLGYNGRMISGSKSGYRERHPNNFAIFNANLCVKDGKFWFGDVDITYDKEILSNFAKDENCEVYVLYEMDGRFDNEDSPLIKKAAVIFHSDGTFTIKEELRQYYTDLINDSKHRI